VNSTYNWPLLASLYMQYHDTR